jgi:membrane protein YdbS with pleckstrin-like domain
MNYQLTCVCGHRFLIQDDQLSRTVTCPACKRPLMPVAAPAGEAAVAPTPTPAAPASAEATTRCPFCGEVILAIAKKCKHCGEFLDRAAAPAHPLASAGTTPAASGGVAGGPNDPAPVYALTVSQWDNFWRFLICTCVAILACAAMVFIPPLKPYASLGVPGVAVLALFVVWFFFLSTRNSRCYVRPTRIDTEVGILSKDLNSIELFRISDMELKQGVIERLLRIGTIRIFSTDATTPELTLYQIPKAREVYKYLQNQIPLAAKQRGAMYFEK